MTLHTPNRSQSLLLLFLVLLPLIEACTNKSIPATNTENERRFNFDSFSKKIQLTGQSLNMGDHMGDGTDFFLAEDRFIIYEGLIDGFHCHIYDLETKQLFHFAKDGRGPGEILTVFSFDYRAEDRSIWVHDIKRNTWTGYTLDKLLQNHNQHAYFAELKFEVQGVQYPLWIDKDTIVSVSFVDSKARLYYFDQQGQLIDTRADIPEKEDEKLSDFVHAQIHQGMLSRAPNCQNLIFASRYSDLIQIFSEIGGKQKKLRGPELVKPVWELLDIQGYQNFAITDHTIEANTQIAATNYGFLLLFSGKSDAMAPKSNNEGDMWRSMTNQVLMLDWSGIPLYHYHLDRRVINIAVSSNGKYLYGLDYLQPDIVRFEL